MQIRVLAALLAVACLVGCQDPGEAIQTLGDPPEVEEGWVRYETPPLFIPAGTEKIFCWFTTFEETGGIHDAIHHTDSPLLHLDHILGKTAPQHVDIPDGEVVDCETLGTWWSASAPLYDHGDTANGDGGLGLPDGIAFPITEGQRFLVDSHFINATEEDAWANVWIDLQIIPEEEIVHPAGAIQFDLGHLRIPQGPHTEVFDCVWDREVTILSVGPHLHEQCDSFYLDWIAGDGSGDTERLLAIDEWQQTFQELPPSLGYEPGSLTVSPGEVFRTTCNWDNQTDHELLFPEEMCTTLGVGYPLPRGAACMDGEVVDAGEDVWTGDGARVGGTLTTDVPLAPGGDVWLLLFDERPGFGNAAPVEQIHLEGVDLNTGVDYEFPGIPVRDEPWILWAIYDADRNWLTSHSPNTGDGELLSDSGDTMLEFVVESADAIDLDIVFNSVVP